ncbi:MAG: ArsR family transcriptional regulator [Candidatus Helarchaeota archaeon]|nr:ArsR family transcriptional regulator [Candidatus Helarchaeota archaeon]
MADAQDLLLKESEVSDVIELNLEDPQVFVIMKALSSKTRWNILKILKERLDVCQTAKKLKQTEANISAQIKILEKANLLNPKYEAGRHGVRKFCELNLSRIIINI